MLKCKRDLTWEALLNPIYKILQVMLYCKHSFYAVDITLQDKCVLPDNFLMACRAQGQEDTRYKFILLFIAIDLHFFIPSCTEDF